MTDTLEPTITPNTWGGNDYRDADGMLVARTINDDGQLQVVAFSGKRNELPRWRVSFDAWPNPPESVIQAAIAAALDGE